MTLVPPFVRSLRARLTGAFVVLGGILVVVAWLGVSELLTHAVWRPLDVAIEEETDHIVAVVRAPLAIGDDRLFHSGLADLTRAVQQIGSDHDLGPGKFVEVVDGSGRRRAVVGEIPAGLAARPASPTSHRSWEFLDSGRSVFRILRQPLHDGGWISVGVPADRQIQSLAHARIALAVGAGTFLIALGALAFQITARATAEIDDVAMSLEALEADSLDRRIRRRHTTEVDRLVAALNRMLARLEQAVSHLRHFTADAAHELRTPIAALRARIEGTLGSDSSGDDCRDALIDALAQTERLGVLAEDLLTLSAVESVPVLESTTVDLAELVREVSEFFSPVADEHGRQMSISLAPEATVRGSERLLKRVLINLIDNSFRHSRPGGRVAVRVSRRADRVVLFVEDEGPGFDRQSIDLFRRFAHGTSARAGTGLGLALCHEILRKHGASIEIDSSPSSGTTVSIALVAASSV